MSDKKIHRKQLLLLALHAGGVVFVGPRAREVNARAARFVLGSIARKLRADRLEAGARAGAALLAGVDYSERHARRALAALVDAGIVQRERSRQGRSRGTSGEPPAWNAIHPWVIEAHVTWALAWRAAGPRRPENCVLEIPLFQPYPPGEQALAQYRAEQHDRLAGWEHDVLSGGLIHTPPPARRS